MCAIVCVCKHVYMKRERVRGNEALDKSREKIEMKWN